MNIELEPTPVLGTRQRHGRVMNEIAQFLRNRLTVPHIYLKPRILGSEAVDVLAVDQGGSGDVHGVEIKVVTILPTRTGIRKLLAPLKTLPVHYRYLAVQTSAGSVKKWSDLREYDEFFDTSGVGRIGVITFDERLLQKNAEFDPTLLSIIVRPERYLVRGERLAVIERFLEKARPDMQVRI